MMDAAGDPDAMYDEVIMPYKGALEAWYVNSRSIVNYFLLIFVTGWVVLFPSSGLLWLFSMPMVGDGLLCQLESGWEFRPVDALPAADAVVVLGGAFSSGRGE